MADNCSQFEINGPLIAPFFAGRHLVETSVAEDADKLVDVMEGCDRLTLHTPTTNSGASGFVALVDVMPRMIPARLKSLTSRVRCDYRMAQAARVSYGLGTRPVSDDETLIRALLRDSHTSPAEMVRFTFHICAPLFIARQWMRHRMASVNEESARYSEMKDEFSFIAPENFRGQGTGNKQVGSGVMTPIDRQDAATIMERTATGAYAAYQELLGLGVSREQARLVMPVCAMTQWYWTIDLHNLLHFLRLRSDVAHAQREFVTYALMLEEFVKMCCPAAHAAWCDYHKNGLRLSSREIMLVAMLSIEPPDRRGEVLQTAAREWFPSVRERAAFLEKVGTLLATEAPTSAS